MEQFLNWEDLKALKIQKGVPFQYVEKLSKYEIWIQDGVQIYNTVLFKDVTDIGGIDVTQNNLDLTDWETNFKANANKKIIQEIQNTLKGFSESGNLYSARTLWNTSTVSPTFENKILIHNPSGSGINMFIYKIWIDPRGTAQTSSNYELQMFLSVDPVVTSLGTLKFNRNWNRTSSNVAKGEYYYNPTISSIGDSILGAGNINAPITWKFDFGFVVGPGDDILLRTATNNANDGFIISVIWGEK